uniref:Uncharacterized protein n=2 Tax=Clytia hemisphaerica TaxID=252671 RepID=A0A7M5XAU2_9CNID
MDSKNFDKQIEKLTENVEKQMMNLTQKLLSQQKGVFQRLDKLEKQANNGRDDKDSIRSGESSETSFTNDQFSNKRNFSITLQEEVCQPRIIQVKSRDNSEDSSGKISLAPPEQLTARSKKQSFLEENCNIMEEKISSEKQSYAEGLTIHGANRIATGGAVSKVIWSILVACSLLTAIMISKEHWESFLSDHSVSNFVITVEKEIKLPSITICNYAAINRERRHFSDGIPTYKRPLLVSDGSMRLCGQNLTQCGYNGTTLIKVQNYTADYSSSSLQNNLVDYDDTTNCFTVRGSTQYVPSDILSVQAVANRTPFDELWTELYVHPTEETFQEASPTVYWASEGWYHVILDKKIITRLGLPFTDCVEGKGSYEQNKFKGNYTVTKCKKGCFWEKVFEKCGAIPQMYKKHMREPRRFDNTTFINNTEMQTCLKEVEGDFSVTEECNRLCKLQPCYEEDIKLSLDYHKAPSYPNFYELAFTFHTFLVEHIEEKPAYTWQDLFANFGGCVGLMTGASILSAFELMIFFGLIVLDFFDLYTKCQTKIHPNP